MPGPFAAGKLHNLELAARTLNDLVVSPGRVLSLGHVLGDPTLRRGYREGRMVTASGVVSEAGGGLCQLSGMVYLLSLKVGLRVLERHAHSVDLYDDHTRFCPLGADATLVYGYRDLRVENTLPVPIAFRFRAVDAALVGSLCAPRPLAVLDVRFRRTDLADGTRDVETWVEGRLVARSWVRVRSG
jgi:vancomycin resistance protein VanW